MTNTPNRYDEPIFDSDADADSGSFDDSSETDTIVYYLDYDELSSEPEFPQTETDYLAWETHDFYHPEAEENPDFYLPEEDNPFVAPAKRPWYRTMMVIIGLLVIAGLVAYWLAPVLNHFLNPLPLPPLPPAWMA